MTGRQRVLEILELVQANGSDYASPSMTVDQALDSIEEVMKEVLGERQPIAESPTRPIPDLEALHQNKLLTIQLGRWESK